MTETNFLTVQNANYLIGCKYKISLRRMTAWMALSAFFKVICNGIWRHTPATPLPPLPAPPSSLRPAPFISFLLFPFIFGRVNGRKYCADGDARIMDSIGRHRSPTPTPTPMPTPTPTPTCINDVHDKDGPTQEERKTFFFLLVRKSEKSPWTASTMLSSITTASTRLPSPPRSSISGNYFSGPRSNHLGHKIASELKGSTCRALPGTARSWV